MDVARKIQKNWDLGPVLEVRDLGWSGACFLVVTGQGRFVYKQMGRPDFVAIHDRMQRALNSLGFVQAAVIRSRDGLLMQPDGFSVFEYVPGDAPLEYTDEQFVSASIYLRRFNQALKSVPFDPGEIEVTNDWDEIRSTERLCLHASTLVEQSVLNEADRALLGRAVEVLRGRERLLAAQPRQLIHSDVGPGNIIFSGRDVKTIIDFTPDYENEMYSLAQFLYWTCLWVYDPRVSPYRIRAALDVYQADPGIEVLGVYLVKACLYRIIGRALNMQQSGGAIHSGRLQRRLLALDHLLDLQADSL